MLAELGPEEYAAVGTVQEPGTILLTAGGSVTTPAVVEVTPGVPLADVLNLCEAKIGDGLLLGGYHGTWMSAEDAYGAILSRRGAKESGGELGAGIVVTRCQGHGLCAHLVPELVKLDRHGFPVFMDTGVPSWLLGEAQKAVEMCPALALRVGTK